MKPNQDELETITFSWPPCPKCKHVAKGKNNFTCLAFPDGIPDEIISGDNLHGEPLPEQKNKIVFELK